MTREQAINYLICRGITEYQVSEIVRALTYKPRDCANCKHYIVKDTRTNWGSQETTKIYGCERWECEYEPTTKNNLGVEEVTALAEWTAKLTKASEDAYNKGYADGKKEQEPRWIPVKTINQCYIPELKDYHGKVIATYLTGKHIKPQVTTISISYGRIENKKYTDIVAIMYLPEPYSEVEE